MRKIQILIAIDQFFNTLLAGYADETLSARSHRMQCKKKRWLITRKIIDSIFFWQDEHCLNSYLSEIKRKHYPPHYYEKYNKPSR